MLRALRESGFEERSTTGGTGFVLPISSTSCWVELVAVYEGWAEPHHPGCCPYCWLYW